MAVTSQAVTGSGRLFILDESGSCGALLGDPAGTLTKFFPCVLANTNFNRLYGAGQESLSWGGYVQGDGGCRFAVNGCCVASGNSCCGATDTCTATDVNNYYAASWKSALQCAENKGGWALQDNDLILVVQNDTTQHGCNNSSAVALTIPGGGTRSVRGAFIGGSSGPYGGGGTSTHCGHQTGIGLHEIYEAVTDGVSGDECLYGCPPATKFSSLNCGGSQAYDAQLLSPSGATCSTPMAQRCVAVAYTCIRNCPSLSCSPDGCGGQCQCPAGYSCGYNGSQLGCIACTPNCPPLTCGADGCGGQCQCPAGYTCGYNGSTLGCIAHPTCPPASEPCNTSNATGWCGAGKYCGSSGMTAANPNTLYTCSYAGQVDPPGRVCSEECHFRPGLDDACWEDTSTCYNWRYYNVDACGWDYVNGNPRIDYHCDYGSKSIYKWCAPGHCAWGPINDTCN